MLSFELNVPFQLWLENSLNLIELLNAIKAVICSVKNVYLLQVTRTVIVISMMAWPMKLHQQHKIKEKKDDDDDDEKRTDYNGSESLYVLIKHTSKWHKKRTMQ